MFGIVKNIKRFMNRLSAERITVAMSICYVVGVILLLLHNSIFVGDIDFDFIRIKPIVVGIEYLLYLGLPLLLVCLPIFLTSKKWFNWFWGWFNCGKTNVSMLRRIIALLLHVFIYLLEVGVLAFFLGLMLHYFLPYTEYYLPNGDKFLKDGFFALVMISCSFWRIYLCWDICLLGFSALFVVAFIWTLKCCKYCYFRTSVARRFYSMAVIILLPFGFLTNMFYFVRDVYPNISQAACGGAPISGIITIESPGKQLRCDVDGSEFECNEITKLCNVLQANDDFWYIDEQLRSDSVLFNSSFRLRTRRTRIRTADIKQFTPLTIPVFYRNGNREAFHQDSWRDLVHNIDLMVEFEFATKDVTQALREVYKFNTTNDVKMILIADNFPVVKLNAAKQNAVKICQTNISYRVEFRQVPISHRVTVPEFMNAITNSYCHCELLNLPEISHDLNIRNLTMEFIVNFNVFFTLLLDPAIKYSDNITISHGINSPVARQDKGEDNMMPFKKRERGRERMPAVSSP